jgi:hypothetical protein
MTNIENTQECFVQLWLRLERTRQLLYRQCKRFCVRRILKTWFAGEANNDLTSLSHLTLGHQQASLHGSRSFDDFIWEICSLSDLAGWDELPLPSLYPRKHRELLRAIVSVKTGISYYKVDLKALDAAYSIAFPKSTPLNVNKKKK